MESVINFNLIVLDLSKSEEEENVKSFFSSIFLH